MPRTGRPGEGKRLLGQPCPYVQTIDSVDSTKYETGPASISGAARGPLVSASLSGQVTGSLEVQPGM
jgi:hypothetical protein